MLIDLKYVRIAKELKKLTLSLHYLISQLVFRTEVNICTLYKGGKYTSTRVLRRKTHASCVCVQGNYWLEEET